MSDRANHSPTWTHESASRCEALLVASHLGIYRENTFRITGLPVEATEREVKRQADKLKMLEDLGREPESRHAYPLQPPPTADQIRAAIQRLRNPEQRLIDEFFWFWPERFGEGGSDPAMQSFLSGDAGTAMGIWQERAADTPNGAAARHNLAILYHLVALDWTEVDLCQPVDAEREEKIQHYWKESFSWWEVVATDPEIWSKVKERIAALGDPRLKSGFARRMETALPEALDKINAEIALRFAEASRLDLAEMHIRFMNETHQGLDDVEKTSALVLNPTRRRIQQHISASRDQAKSDSKSGLVAATHLIGTCDPLQKLFELFHGSDSYHKTELFDEVAAAAFDCCVSYSKATKDHASSNNLLRQALEFATSVELRQRIQAYISNAPLEPVYEELIGIQQSDEVAFDRLAKIKGRVIPYIARLMEEDGREDETVNDLKDACAIVLRGISISAHNNDHDYPTALEAIQLALKLVVGEKHRAQFSEDFAAIQRTVAANTCHYCKVNPSDQAKSVDMYGDVVRGFGSVRYRTASVSVPSCGACARKESIGNNILLGFSFGTPILAALWALISSKGPDLGMVLGVGFISLFFGIVAGAIISWIWKRAAGLATDGSYQGIKDMKARGWRIGSKPGRYV